MRWNYTFRIHHLKSSVLLSRSEPFFVLLVSRLVLVTYCFILVKCDHSSYKVTGFRYQEVIT